MGMNSNMFREELKEHCKRKIAQFEKCEALQAVTPSDWKLYEEHKYVLGMIEKLEKIEQAYSDYLEDLDNDEEDDDNAEEKLVDRLGEIL